MAMSSHDALALRVRAGIHLTLPQFQSANFRTSHEVSLDCQRWTFDLCCWVMGCLHVALGNWTRKLYRESNEWSTSFPQSQRGHPRSFPALTLCLSPVFKSNQLHKINNHKFIAQQIHPLSHSITQQTSRNMTAEAGLQAARRQESSLCSSNTLYVE